MSRSPAFDDAAIERVVVRAPNWLGDAVLALPALAAVRRRFARAELTVAGPASVAAVFRERTEVAPDRVLELSADPRGALAALEGGRFDLGVLFPNSFRSAWQLRRARVPHRWGYATASRGWLLTRAVRRRPARSAAGPHQCDYYRALVGALDCTAPAGEPPRLAASEASAARAAALLAQHKVPAGVPIVALAPGAAYGQAKQWPPDRMAELASRLVAAHDAVCLVVGASHDRPAARAIESWLRAHVPAVLPRVVDLVGRTSLGALVGVAAQSSVLVSNDSGAMHLAAALGRPVVAIFGPTDERATRPLGDHEVIFEPVFCRPCMLRDCPIDHRCMKRITVDTVLAAVSRRLAAAPAV
jgi:heptosyltransferase-2